MNAQQKRQEKPREDKRQKGELAKRYGEIGISAVAAAVENRPCEKPRKKDREIVPDDCD